MSQRVRTTKPPSVRLVSTRARPTAPVRERMGTGEGVNVRLQPGREVPGTRYRIIRWLGEGGMGTVYEAVHMDIERRVALKVLGVDRRLDPAAAERFRDEARAASRIGSEHIVDIFDFGELPDGRLVFTMELLDGHGLVDELDQCPMDLGRFIGILRQACKGLAAAHSAGIVHRDIKPENLLLARKDGREDSVKIVDFGIARIASVDHDDELAGAGTPHYMAPEMCEGRDYDARVDMYALACTAYELLAARPPFNASKVEDILRAQVDEQPVPPSVAVPGLDVPKALEDVIMRCLEKRAADRFADMADLEAAICEAQIEARLETPWDDLPLPDIDPERRARLLRDMPSPDAALTKSRERSWVWPALVGGSLFATVAFGVGWIAATGPSPEEASHVESVVQDARKAASRAYYVYPPPVNKQADTAYRKIVELEEVDGSAEDVAHARASELRSEFAATLVRLGDRYWQRDGGRPFARDYYLQALVFESLNDRAKERMQVSPGLLMDLRARAATGEFTDAELYAVEPLLPLAAESDAAAAQGLVALYENDAGRSVSRDSHVESLLTGMKRPIRRKRSTPPAAEVAPPDPTVEEEEALPEEPEAMDDAAKEPKQVRDPEAARALAKKGVKALRSGNRAEAEELFHRALERDRRSAAALIGLSDLFFDRTNYQKAVQFGRKAVRYAPRNGSYRIRLGDAYFKVLRYADARTQYLKAKQLGQTEAEPRLKKLNKKLGQ